MAGMAKLLMQEQRQLSRALYLIHRAKGFTADYTLVTDFTTDPLTTVTFTAIPMGKTALVELQQLFGGRYRTIPAGGWLFTQEQQPYFVISRRALKVGLAGATESNGDTIAPGTQYIPTIKDYFTWDEDGATQTVQVASEIIQLSSAVEGWVLPYRTIFKEEAHG